MFAQPTEYRAALTAAFLGAMLCTTLGASQLLAQQDSVIRISVPVGRAFPITTAGTLAKASVAVPEVADINVISPRELVINAKALGETDAVYWLSNGTRVHYRVTVRPAADQKQVAVYIKFAEVQRDLLRQLGVSFRFRDQNGHARVGTGIFNTDNVIGSDGSVTIPGTAGFLTVLTDFNTERLLGFLDAEEQNGRATTLAEPNVLAANRSEANFLAGGEIPIPIVQGGAQDVNGNRVTISYKEFGVRLRVQPDILNDTLIKLTLRPEVSSLDFSNAIIISGFRIPAFKTRRVETTVDVRRDQSLIISGLFNVNREQVKTGIPFLQDIPILGHLFASTRWQKHETELLVIVTPVIIDPNRPRGVDTVRLVPDTVLPAREVIKKRLVEPPVAPRPKK